MQPYPPQHQPGQPYQSGQPYPPAPQYPPGSQYVPGPPPAPFPGAPIPRPKRRTGLVVGLVVGAVVLLLCGGPVAFFGIRYATFETGPHESLPNVCTVMNGPTIKSLVGDAINERSKADAKDAGYPKEGCLWRAEHTSTGVQVSLDATRYTRSFWSGSTDKAREYYESDQRIKRGIVNSSPTAQAMVALSGVGNEGFCTAMAWGAQARYECIARDGNVAIRINVVPPYKSTPTELTSDQVFRMAEAIRDTIRGLGNDLIDDL